MHGFTGRAKRKRLSPLPCCEFLVCAHAERAKDQTRGREGSRVAPSNCFTSTEGETKAQRDRIQQPADGATAEAQSLV